MKILFVSIAFPPKNDPESLQVLKYYSELIKKDLDISVVTSSHPTLFMDVDENLKKYSTGYKQLISLDINENKYLNFIKRKLNSESLNYPDSKFSFHKQSKKVVDKLIDIPDVIYSRSYPLSSTFMAYELAVRFDKPWILHLSDPWTFKSMTNAKLSRSEKWNLEKEELFFERASFINLTSLKTIEFYKNKYPQFGEKYIFTPNVYKSNEVAGIKNGLISNKRPIKFIYTGGLTKQRNPLVFLECIKCLENEILDFEKMIAFEFIGQKDSFIVNLAKEYDLKSVKFKDSVSYYESKNLQKNADVLILIDSDVTGSHLPVYFPSKILDYMITRNPILALTPSGSTTDDVVNQYRLGKSFSYNEKELLKQFFVDCISGKVDLSQSKSDLPKDFDVNFNVDKLYNLFLQLDAGNKENSNSIRNKT